ncbi:MAG: AAA family ATPase [Candidatus Levybacteria bacterium]|nr:AAA family ATPase [Candidatus Levybacteria bacterium]
MVFYLKYRPKKISELDSQTLVEKLSGILKGKLPDNIPHAFLFTGSKGLGKTSTARILAKSINCTNRKNNEIEPCNICASCKSITNGSNLDVLEIDAASNRGIDEIRDLREKIRLAPVSSKKKIYIIDEVHMLTTEAFNALLKTLEEPPNHAFFVL